VTTDPRPTLLESFASLPDPRVQRTQRHKLIDIVAIAILGMTSGADTWVDIAEFGRAKEPWLRQFLELPNGIPSHDTFGRVFARLDPEQFRSCFLDWVRTVQARTHGQVIAIDGKTLRRSHDRVAGHEAIHMVSAWATANHLVLGQVQTDAKSNEITAIPNLLRLLDLSGCIVTIDAMGCQRDIALQIQQQQGDYVLAVKENQQGLYDRIQWLFERAERADYAQVESHDACKTVEKGHGRIEIRALLGDLGCYLCPLRPERALLGGDKQLGQGRLRTSGGRHGQFGDALLHLQLIWQRSADVARHTKSLGH
jgi:predicted transposase YbfD/YdcC